MKILDLKKIVEEKHSELRKFIKATGTPSKTQEAINNQAVNLYLWFIRKLNDCLGEDMKEKIDLTLENRALLKQKHNLTDIIDEYNNKSFLYRMFNKIKIKQ